MVKWSAVSAMLAMTLTLVGCGGIEGVSQSKALALLDSAGKAIMGEDWAALASLHPANSGITAEALAAQLGGYGATIGGFTNVNETTIEEIEGPAKAELANTANLGASAEAIRCIGQIVLGNGPEPNAPAYEGVRVNTIIGEENGQYVILAISSVTLID